MLNNYPLWKYFILIIVLIFGLLYSIPNFYGDYPAIQVTNVLSTNNINETSIKIENILKTQKINSKGVFKKYNTIFVVFSDSTTQFNAYEILKKNLDKNLILALNITSTTPKWLTKIGAAPIRLGLDLRGGIHFLIKVDINTALVKIYKQIADDLHHTLNKKKISNTIKHSINDLFSDIYFKNVSDLNNMIPWLSSNYCDLTLNKVNKNQLRINLAEHNLHKIIKHIIQKNIAILRNRINQLGIHEAIVYGQNLDCIVVELPGVQDITIAKNILGTMSNVEFRLVNTTVNQINIFNGNIPIDSELKYTQEGSQIVLYKEAILTGEHIINATYNINEYNQPQVNITLNKAGGIIMSNFTKNNIGKLLATLFIEYIDFNTDKISKNHQIMKNEKVINIANIQSKLNNQFRIIGIKDINQARQLSILLRAGILITPIKIIEERIIGPSLGMKNIIQGLTACLYGLLASIIFIIIKYLSFGLIAAIALIFNLLLIISIISVIPGTILTMSGIAGIILTLAVAVDANVLINERIKEELNNGKSIQQAIHTGYRAALSSIIDANVTTFITSMILYIIDTSSIRSFAIVTMVGIATSMFTSIIGTRAIVNLFYGKKNINKLYI